MSTPHGLFAGMAADWPTYTTTCTDRRARTMPTLTDLAREAADLNPDGEALVAVTYMAGQWNITVHVDIPEAFQHCDTMHDDDEGPLFGTIRVTADTLDAAVTEAARRVAAAVADTPCPNIP
ncbi:MAG: hypothetical protein U1C73_08270 [Dietzia sp.]|nr:hypothetical protein [Dietzia sp.]